MYQCLTIILLNEAECGVKNIMQIKDDVIHRGRRLYNLQDGHDSSHHTKAEFNNLVTIIHSKYFLVLNKLN